MLRVKFQVLLAFLVYFARPSCQGSVWIRNPKKAPISGPSDSYYTAGVVEFQSASGSLTSLERVNDNVEAYLKIIASNEAAETDIIAFPEGTLNNADQQSYVPNPLDNIAPCNQSKYAEFLQKLSCQAKTSQKYIVINIVEKEDCSKDLQAANDDKRPCAENGLTNYNTNVVLDRNGVVISRYRKFNLYYEPWNVTKLAEYGQFDTDFGVKFGHFICFDILFYTPSTELVKLGITDFIFTTMWFSELPFLTAAQTQQSWSYSYDVNLLAAGASNPLSGNTGTGIYVGEKGTLVSIMSSIPERKLYVAKVPKKNFVMSSELPIQQLQIRKKRATTSQVKGLLVKRDSRIDSFLTAEFNPSLLYTRICHDGLCCHFTTNTTKLTPPSNTKSYQYRLAAFNGKRIYPGIEPLGWSVCSMIACTDNTLESCGLAFDENETVSPEFILDEMLIEADFDSVDNILIMPNSVDDSLMPLTVNSFEFNVTDKGYMKNVRYSLLTPRDNLLNFGIYVNTFYKSSAISVAYVSELLVLLTAVSGILINLRT